jgi:hypothetical protein
MAQMTFPKSLSAPGSKPGQLDIVCATWNMENGVPSPEQIDKFYDALLKITAPPGNSLPNAPDFVVIGLQEAVPSEVEIKEGDFFDMLFKDNVIAQFKQGDLVAQRCAKASKGVMEPVLDKDGQRVRGPLIVGSTKPPKPCCQHIGILRHKDSKWSVINIEQKDKSKGPASEKGAVALVVDIEHGSQVQQKECVRLVFVSTHVDAEEGQEKEFTEYIDWSRDLAKGGKIQRTSVQNPINADQVSNICFFMGDLNFRLKPYEDEPRTLAGRYDTADKWADALLDAGKRNLLFQYYDSLQRTTGFLSLTGEWEFPVPMADYGAGSVLCFPTYQREYKSDKAAGHVTTLTTQGKTDHERTVAVKMLFDLTDEDVLDKSNQIVKALEFDKDRQAWNLGWLDRIGYSIVKKTISNIKFEVASCWDCFGMVQSDHTPIFLHLSVNVTH